MHRLGRAVAEIGERISFENVEDFADDHAAGRWRRRGDDLIAAVIAADRFEFADLIALEILLCENAALVRARLDDGICDRTPIEGVRAFLRNAGKRRRKVRLNQPVADCEGLSIGLQEDRCGGRITGQALVLAIEGVNVALLEHEPFARELDGRFY